MTDNIDLSNGVILNANNFYNDRGNLVTEFKIYNPNGYVNLFINGVMQEGSIYSVNSGALLFNIKNGIIRKGSPIIIESIGFTVST